MHIAHSRNFVGKIYRKIYENSTNLVLERLLHNNSKILQKYVLMTEFRCHM